MPSVPNKRLFKHIIRCLRELTEDYLPCGTQAMVSSLITNMRTGTCYNDHDVAIMTLYALCLLDKLSHFGYKLTSSTINLLFQTAVLISSEFLDDEPYDVHLWVNILVSGVTANMIRSLKYSFLDHLKWDVQVSSKDLKSKCPPGFSLSV